MNASSSRSPRSSPRGRSLASLALVAALLPACAATPDALLARGDLHGACRAAGPLPAERAAVARAARERIDLAVSIEVLDAAAIRALAGVVPTALEGDLLLARERYELVAAPGFVEISLEGVDTMSEGFRAAKNLGEDDLVALFAPPPKPGEAPEPSDVGGGGLGGLLADGAIRLFSANQHSLGEIDRAIDSANASRWNARREAELRAWRAKLEADPEKRAARDKLRPLVGASKTIVSLRPGGRAERLVLLEPRDRPDRRGLHFGAILEVPGADGRCSVLDTITVPLPAREGDARAEVNALFGGAPRKLAALGVRR